MGSGIKICGTAKPSIASHALRRARCAVTPGNAGTLLVDWAVARRAARHCMWVQVVGVDTDFSAVATVTDSDATLIGLHSGKTVKVRRVKWWKSACLNSQFPKPRTTT